MRIQDALIGTLLALVGIAVLWYVGGFPKVAGQTYGPDLFPRVVGIGLLCCGAGLMARGFTHDRKGALLLLLPAPSEAMRGCLAAMYVVAAVTAIVFFGNAVGVQLLIFSILLVGLLARFRKPVFSLALALGLTVFFDLVFRSLLRVPLPMGLLQGFL